MRTRLFATGIALSYLMLCAGCTSAPPAPPPLIVYNSCPQVSLCPMPASTPQTNGDLSADIRQLEHALVQCALQVETLKHCQDEINAKTQLSAQRPD